LLEGVLLSLFTPQTDVLTTELSRRKVRLFPASRTWRVALLVPVVLLVHGYHPYADDAGLYVAGLRRLLNPGLYPLNGAFVDAQAHWSAFAWLMACVVRATHLSLSWILFGTYLLSIVAFLAGCQAVVSRLFVSRTPQACALVLAAACFTMPAAGTALFLMDPYVTARSFSTPIALFAVAACLDRAWKRTVLLLLLGVLMHPLMGCFVVGFVLLQALIAIGRVRSALAVCSAGCAAFGVAFMVAHVLPGPAGYQQIVALRDFLFLARWHWYQQLGLALPLILLAIGVWRLGSSTHKGSVCLACILLGAGSVLVSALFVPSSGPYLLVPLQVLRSFHLIYLLGVLLLGGWLGTVRFRPRFLPAAILGCLFVFMFCVQHATWVASGLVELPRRQPVNPWEQAFLWIRGNTPANAVFAVSSRLTLVPGEDEQGFRAISERDQLADNKDAGVAVLVPRLAPRALRENEADLHLNRITDAQRIAVLRPLGANWILLSSTAVTHLPCPWRNRVVRVCRLVN
jgi:hypothetical protein